MRRRVWFRRRMYFRGGRSGAKYLLRMLAVLLLALVLLFLLDSRLRPVVSSIAESQARNMVMKAVNDAVLEAVEQMGLGYGDLVSIHKGDDGRITSIEMNTASVNRLQAQIGNAIAQQIAGAKSYEISIPVGSLSGSELLLGRGPCLKLKMTLEASTVLQVRSQFTSAGVNQTLHQVMLDIQTHVLFITPDQYEPTEVQTSACVAQTVIVGEVPELYAGVSVGEITQK
ncbi:MAG TPA: sporulation protein YunB [Candidatus Fimivicinus intestinavium]|nr:sporulation protein YunB [Candidatus Fimivicinus intestinavium]